MPDASSPTVSARDALTRLMADAAAMVERPDVAPWIRDRCAAIVLEVATILEAAPAGGDRPVPGTQVTVRELPACDLCGDGTPALYDSRTLQGPWGYLCEEHWQSHGVGQLGTGHGQRLVVGTPA